MSVLIVDNKFSNAINDIRDAWLIQQIQYLTFLKFMVDMFLNAVLFFKMELTCFGLS